MYLKSYLFVLCVCVFLLLLFVLDNYLYNIIYYLMFAIQSPHQFVYRTLFVFFVGLYQNIYDILRGILFLSMFVIIFVLIMHMSWIVRVSICFVDKPVLDWYICLVIEMMYVLQEKVLL